ncbi:hypothetical protein ABGB12_05675 [Actinocorallia sp. B10E7]|uniref:hypothetical protein n=1 Tax=Actinocorallia sp. B10E7 TaxID=3153558 RepID=UPI00325D1A2F
MRARPVIAACLVLTAACGGYSPPGSLSLRELPRPDVCRKIPVEVVEKALGASPSRCAIDVQKDTYGARFQGLAKKKPVALVVSYQRRYDPKTGLDMWQVHGVAEGERSLLIGVGEGALFDPSTATMLAVSKHLLVTVGVQSAGELSREGLPDRLLPVLEAALAQGEDAIVTPSPWSGPPTGPGDRPAS